MKFLRKLRTNKKGVTGMVIMGIVALIISFVGIMLTLVITANFAGSVDTLNLGTSGNASRTNVESNIYGSLNIAGLIPYAVVASVIIGVLISGFALYSRIGA